MSTIHQLSPDVIAKIAAGEVIERPSYAVKELLDNAIDAKATEITVYIEEAGLKKIMVQDNGEGMSREDVELSIKPHTTSKLTSDDELVGIKTLGFRGEALASLAAVSKLSLKSRTVTDATGTEILVQYGKILETKPVGMASGTTVIVEDLFAAVPARKKFLKSMQTEFRHIVDVVTNTALVHPNIHVRLLSKKKTIIDTPIREDQKERIFQLLGLEISSQLVPITFHEPYLEITGFIAKPQVYSSSQNKQFIFINKRKVTDKLISLALKEAYGNLLDGNSYPIGVIFLTVPFDMVDVNVHPRKEQVSFINHTMIFQTVKSEVHRILQENNVTFQNLSWKKDYIGTTSSYGASIIKDSLSQNDLLSDDTPSSFTQLHKTYILSQVSSGFILLDQHAAHERILFEKLSSAFQEAKEKSTGVKLEKPLLMHLLATEKIIVEEYKKLFESVGFKWSIRNDTFYLTYVPELLRDRNHTLLVKEMLTSLEEKTSVDTIDTVSTKMIAFLACRAAVKAGDSLSAKQMKTIAHDLKTIPNRATCPHGRPTTIHVSLNQLHKMFKRI